jgi:hypothetical protein
MLCSTLFRVGTVKGFRPVPESQGHQNRPIWVPLEPGSAWLYHFQNKTKSSISNVFQKQLTPKQTNND